MAGERTTQTRSRSNKPQKPTASGSGASPARSNVRANLRGLSYKDGVDALKPAPVMRDGQKNAPSTVAPQAPVPRVTGEITIDAKGSDVANRALALMATGTVIERNTRARIVAGRHKLAYLEDLAADPMSDELLPKWGFNKGNYTLKLDPWTGKRILVPNTATGFALGNNIVGSRKESVEVWKGSLLCHEVSHIVNNDRAHKLGSFGNYKAEFRAFWVGGYQGVADKAERARRIKAHILQSYELLKSRYDTDAGFRKNVDEHIRPDASDNLDNH